MIEIDYGPESRSYETIALERSLKGKNVVDVTHDEWKITFTLKGGETVVWEVEAECCSTTWINHANLNDIRGTVYRVEAMDLPDGSTDNDMLIQHYGYVIYAEYGMGDIDFRNQSNGHYGGSMKVAKQ